MRNTDSDKNLIIALSVAGLLVLFNIVAVTSGYADNWYTRFEQLLHTIHF